MMTIYDPHSAEAETETQGGSEMSTGRAASAQGEPGFEPMFFSHVSAPAQTERGREGFGCVRWGPRLSIVWGGALTGARGGRGLEPNSSEGDAGGTGFFPEAHWGSEQLGGRGLGVIAPAPSPPSPGAQTTPMDEAAFVFIQRSPHARPRLWGTERNKMQPLQAIVRPLHPVFDGEG